MYVVMIGGIDVGEDVMWVLPDELLPDNCVVMLHLFFLLFVVGYQDFVPLPLTDQL